MKTRIVCLYVLLFSALLLGGHSQPSSRNINGIVNGGFETLGQAWETPFAVQYGTTTIHDNTRAHSGLYSARLSGPMNVGPPCTSYCVDSVSAFVGQGPLPDSPDYSLANLADSLGSLSAWWYVMPDATGPYSLRIQIFFSDRSDGSARSLGYWYGTSNVGNVTGRSINYHLGPIAVEAQWFETRRNLYADIRTFGLQNLSSFRILYTSFGAIGNYTNGQTAWVDDVRLVFDPPTALFTAKQPSLSELEIEFNASSSLPSERASIARYTWQFGDASEQVSFLATESHTYSSEGTYQVTLTVEDTRGRLSTASQSVTVSSSPERAALNLLFAYFSGLVVFVAFVIGILGRSRLIRRKLRPRP